ncbi:MAG TPA: protein phosphatase 2C domain-containing protein [Gemmataceae bacterium]|nr:protein phosphatase 2C domain-containing protein [Gemmataceae bacterium]
MGDRWYYTHRGQTHGPVSGAELRQLAARRELLPEDLLWAEGEKRDQAIEAQAALDFSSLPAAPVAAPDWLADVARSEQSVPVSISPDWVRSLAETPEPPSPAEGVAVELVPPLLPPSAGPCRVSVGCATSRGMVRERNEDHFLMQQLAWSAGEDVHEAALLGVADGMGGYQAGDRASGLVIATLTSTLSPVLSGLLRGPSREDGSAVLTRALGEALQECHRVVSQTAASDAACKGMGSTAAVVVVWDGQAFVSHVGDCRVYHQRGETLTQVTRDHTLVARMVELGQLTPEEAESHPARNEVTQALGKRVPIEPSQHTLELQRGDWLIVACDGLAAHVTDDTLRTTARLAAPSAAYLAKRLVELANEGGGTDNCTVVAAYCY